MSTSKSYRQVDKGSPSIFALLVDDFNKMTGPKQKSLWVQLNKQKLSTLAKEIDTMINEARKV